VLGNAERHRVIREAVVELGATQERLRVPDAEVVEDGHSRKPVRDEVHAAVLRVAHAPVDPLLGNREREVDLEP
jgi:hypothetical protein